MKDVLWILLISVLGPFLACLAIWAAVAALWVVTAPICIPIVWIWERCASPAQSGWWDRKWNDPEQGIDDGFDYLARSA
jgi:hypothetical protein